MSERAANRGLPVIALVVLALAAAACGHTGPQRQIVLRAVDPVTSDEMQRAADMLQDRLNRLDVEHASVHRRGPGRLVLEFPRRDARLAGLAARVGELDFYDLEADVAGPSTDGRGGVIADPSIFHLLTQVQPLAKQGTPSAYYLFDQQHRVVAVSTRSQFRVPKGFVVLAVPEKQTVIRCAPESGCPGMRPGQQNSGALYYLFRHDPGNPVHPVPELTGADLKRTAIRADSSTTGAGNVVRLGFKSEGSKKFHDITRAEAARGQAMADAAGQGGASDVQAVVQFAQHFAIVLDGELKSTPYIDYKSNPNGIDPSGNGAEISNIGSFAEAKGLALVLQTGALPARFVRVR